MIRQLIATIAALPVLLAAMPAVAEDAEAVATLGPPPESASGTLHIHGSTDVAPFLPILEQFSAGNPDLFIRYEQRGTNDIYTKAAEACDSGRASADLLVSSSIDQQVKLVNDGCAQPHVSAGTAAVPDWAKWRDEVFGLTRELAVIVYNKQLVPASDVPASRFDLIALLRRPGGRYSGRIATYDIERSGLGYLFAFADSQAATTFGRLIEAFGRNNVVATCCSAEIIDGVAEGRYLVAYNLLGSYALARSREDGRIGIVPPSDYTLVVSRAALVPAHAGNPEAARRLIDYMLSAEGRRLFSASGLIVDSTNHPAIDDQPGASMPSVLRPIAFSPALLVGLDRLKKEQFLAAWRSGIQGPQP
jgi:ABC-type Fe3+ transport system substrate-binding protein